MVIESGGFSFFLGGGCIYIHVYASDLQLEFLLEIQHSFSERSKTRLSFVNFIFSFFLIFILKFFF